MCCKLSYHGKCINCGLKWLDFAKVVVLCGQKAQLPQRLHCAAAALSSCSGIMPLALHTLLLTLHDAMTLSKLCNKVVLSLLQVCDLIL